MRIRFGRYGINDRDGGEAAAVCNLKITGEAVPRRGYVSKPRLAASATLGTEARRCQPQRGCVRCGTTKTRRNRVAVERLGYSLPRVAEAASLGFERQPLRGKTNLNESDVSLPLKIS